MNETPMHYAELEPPPELRPWIASIWVFKRASSLPPIPHHVPLTGGAILSIARGGELILTGERVSPLVRTANGGGVYWGVHLWPAAARALLALDPRDSREWVGPARLRLAADWCERWRGAIDANDEAEIAARIDGLLRELAENARPLDPVVMTAVFRIIRTAGAEPIAEIARAIGLSPRQLRRRFAAETALSPKELARVRRVRAVAASAAAQGNSWVELASRGGYADQSHLVREFRELLGMSPAGFRAHAERIAHRLVE